MKYCVYQDGHTTEQPNGSTCQPWDSNAQLTDEFEIPNTEVEVHSSMGLFDLAVVALFILPSLFGKKR